MENKQGGIKIATAILEVYNAVGYVQKSGRNSAQNYKFAGESDFIEALRPAMITAGLISYPVGIRGACNNITTDGKPKNHAAYIYTFRVVHAESGEYIEVEAAGEGIGNDDKSSYKAATGAQKYALRQLFLIETGDDPDKEPKPEPKPKAKPKTPVDEKLKLPAPTFEDDNDVWAEYTLSLISAIKQAKNFDEFNAIRVANKEGMEMLTIIDTKLRGEVTICSQQKAASFKDGSPKAPIDGAFNG